MLTVETESLPEALREAVESKRIEINRMYGGDALPPGAVPMPRTLARFFTPGTSPAPHGVPPIAEFGLPRGWVMPELFMDDAETLQVLPFRFPWYSRAFAARYEASLFVVARGCMPSEVSAGRTVLVQLGDAHFWESRIGRVRMCTDDVLVIDTPDDEELVLRREEVHFVGKIIGWWDDRVATSAASLAA